MKEFADNSKFDENGRKFSKWLENTVGKGEIVCNEQFSIVFSKGLYRRHVKTRAYFGRVKHLYNTMIYKIGQTVCFANWVQNRGSLSMFCIALGVFIRRNTVCPLFASVQVIF